MDPFSAAPHHDVLVLVVQIAVLLLAARFLGGVAQRFGQPTVVGELLAGILLGPSLLSGLVPLAGEWIIPQTELQGYLIEVVSLIGAIFLLLITGLETDLGLIRRHARTAIGVSFGGILVTFSSGFVLGQLLPDFLLAEEGTRLVFALFVATAMSISAIPVIAKVLMDLDLMRRDVGQTILAAGMSDDTTGWILLSIVAGMASGEALTLGSVLQIVGSVIAFMVVSFTLGRWLVSRLLNFVQDRSLLSDRLLTLVVVMAFAWGAITQALNLEAVLGAFVMGILFGQMRRLPEDVHRKLESMTLAVFAPIFFAVAGLKVNIVSLLTPALVAVSLLVILVASLGKVVGTYLGARLIGRREHWTSLSFGAGLNARGAMEIIIATIGLRLGILSQEMYSIIVLMALATSIMAPTALRWVLKRVQPDAEEVERLKQEELAEDSLVASIHRVLLPVRLREGRDPRIQALEANILPRLGEKLAVTLLNVAPPGNKAEHLERLGELGEIFEGVELTKRVVESDSSTDAILDEAAKDYDLIVMRAGDKSSRSDVLFNQVIDSVIRMAPCPTMVVKGAVKPDSWPPQRILVPIQNLSASRDAAEVAFALARDGREQVTLLNVVVREQSSYRLDASGTGRERQLLNSYQVLSNLRELADTYKARVDTDVRIGSDPETLILDLAARDSYDLIVLGADVRPVSDRLYLGPRVERILNNSPCPVLVVNS